MLMSCSVEVARKSLDDGRFHAVASDGNLRVVKGLLAAYPEGAEYADEYDRLPLHWAAESGHREVVEALLAAYPEGAGRADE